MIDNGLTERLNEALASEETRAEVFANNVRFLFFIVLTCVALLNTGSVSYTANVMNYLTLAIAYAYGLIIFFRLRRSGYHPAMKYITSCADIILVFLLLVLYANIEIPSVALKNYVFLVVFPLIALTAYRYDRRLTLITGGLAIVLYIAMIVYLRYTGMISLTTGGYDRELFSGDVTYIGQGTKLLILAGYVALIAHLSLYSRRLFTGLLQNELTLRVHKELTDWEMKVASQVQTEFLPRTVPTIEGLELSGSVRQGRFIGGDYYDFITRNDGTLMVVTADVSGKGVPAALIMAEVRASTQLLVSMKVGLAELTKKLNALIHQSTDKKSFVTFFAAEINPAGRSISYVNAGHPPPFICSHGEVAPLSRGTFPLGMMASLSGLAVRNAVFQPGDLMVCYTDGILERTNPEGEQFGEERLAGYIPKNIGSGVGTFVGGLFDEVEKFGEGRDPDDDATVAVVRFI